MKVLFIIGTRPEAIRLCPVIRAMKARLQPFEPRVCVVRQNSYQWDSVLSAFDVTSDYDFPAVNEEQTLAQFTSRLLGALDPVISNERPDWILVQGDATTAMVGSLLAFYHGVPLAHLDAGMRTHDKREPFPQEMNRRISDLLADLYFAPSEFARSILLAEGVDTNRILVSGSTTIDSLLYTMQLDYDFDSGPLRDLPTDKRIIVGTTHSYNEFEGGLAEIAEGLKQIAAEYPDDVHIVYSVLLRPEVWDLFEAAVGNADNITLVPPLEYLTFSHLLNQSYLVLTDSGGLQEEACILGKPVLVLRNSTERLEALSAGTVKVVGTEVHAVVKEVRTLLDDESIYSEMAVRSRVYGDGSAAEKICEGFLSRRGAGSYGR